MNCFIGVIFNHIYIYDEIIIKNNVMERSNNNNNKLKHISSKSVQLRTKIRNINPLPRKSKSEVNLLKYNLNTLITITERHEHSQSNNINDNDNDNYNEILKLKEQQRTLDKQLVDYALKRGILHFQEEPIPITNNDEPAFLKQEKPSPYTTTFTQSFTNLLPENYISKNPLKLPTPIHYDTISYSILKDKLNTVLIPSILKNVNKRNLTKALSQSEELLFYLTQIIPIETNNK